jgi:hypothetical protein
VAIGALRKRSSGGSPVIRELIKATARSPRAEESKRMVEREGVQS